MGSLICNNCQCSLEYDDIIEPFSVCECAECNSEIIIPLQIEHLVLHKPLGQQSFFDMYEGYDKHQNMASLIYILDKHTPQYNALRELALEEVNNLAKLRHPNISPVINHGDFEQGFFITEPKIDGYALDTYDPATQDPLEVEKVINILHMVGRAVAFAHHRKIIHHNIRPANIHIDARGTVRLKNFFISRFTYLTERQMEEPSSASPYFISPENVKGMEEDMPADVFSLGATFYLLLTGTYPFTGKTKEELLHSRVKEAEKVEEKKEVDESMIFNADASPYANYVPEKKQSGIQYKAPAFPASVRKAIPIEISEVILSTMAPQVARRPRIPSVLGAIDQHIALVERQNSIQAAQKKMVLTDTVKINTKMFRKKKDKPKGIRSLFKS